MTSAIQESTMRWTQRFGPTKTSEMILPAGLKNQLAAAPAGQHRVYSGPPGSGKTRAALLLCEEPISEWILVNSGERGTIDYLKGPVCSFASTVSWEDNVKTIIYDDADALS